ncbi:hypothetical protein SYNPS1DRAFT_26814 [Syncephalis pseudoplumigaleata]|uniref:Uncharacterized protein n=1 Tax=Syncephalis pseudoplumigaleata TaxID=1712513 RepID=A0A4P9Z4M6_9FUNG|nr:hypothetical protein SYNPS1DRAFT_26814 [Syncephalis pseudoplumigaleata]|eukprot:RKP27533.1 hypothetical protein SYNPS1DRAFT_26814 [Syncephalis pseudoplumigaleata]
MIKHDPQGALNAIEYLLDANGSLEEYQRRSVGVHMQLLSIMALLFMFMFNAYRSIQMTFKRSHKVSSWCCLVSTMTGVAYVGGAALNHHMPYGPSCRTVVWAAIIGMTIATMAMNTLLLERAYLAHQRNRFLLVFGIFLILPAPTLIYRAWIEVEAKFSPASGCYAKYPASFPSFRLLIDLPPNVVFTCAFVMVIYQQYRRYGDRCWKRLARNGIVTMMLVVVSNLTCMLCNVFNAFGEVSDVLFIVDWAITSTLVVENTYRMTSSRLHTSTLDEKSKTPHQRNQHRRLPSNDFRTQAVYDTQYTLR